MLILNTGNKCIYMCQQWPYTLPSNFIAYALPVYVFIYTHYVNIKIGNKMDERVLEDSKEMCIEVFERAKTWKTCHGLEQ